MLENQYFSEGKRGAVGRVADQRSEGCRFDLSMLFLALPLPNSIWHKFTAVVQNAAPGRAPRGVARHGTAPTQPPPPTPSLLLSWRNTRSILLRPILFCIFGMCSPWRKSEATVRTVQMCLLCHTFTDSWGSKLMPNSEQNINILQCRTICLNFSIHLLYFS